MYAPWRPVTGIPRRDGCKEFLHRRGENLCGLVDVVLRLPVLSLPLLVGSESDVKSKDLQVFLPLPRHFGLELVEPGGREVQLTESLRFDGFLEVTRYGGVRTEPLISVQGNKSLNYTVGNILWDVTPRCHGSCSQERSERSPKADA